MAGRICLPGDPLAAIPSQGELRLGPGLAVHESSVVATRLGVAHQSKSGQQLWLEGRQKRWAVAAGAGGGARACGGARRAHAWRLEAEPMLCTRAGTSPLRATWWWARWWIGTARCVGEQRACSAAGTHAAACACAQRHHPDAPLPAAPHPELHCGHRRAVPGAAAAAGVRGRHAPQPPQPQVRRCEARAGPGARPTTAAAAATACAS